MGESTPVPGEADSPSNAASAAVPGAINLSASSAGGSRPSSAPNANSAGAAAAGGDASATNGGSVESSAMEVDGPEEHQVCATFCGRYILYVFGGILRPSCLIISRYLKEFTTLAFVILMPGGGRPTELSRRIL